jgi:hypothetical protein
MPWTQEAHGQFSAFPLRNRLFLGLFPDRARRPDYPPYFHNSGSPELVRAAFSITPMLMED